MKDEVSMLEVARQTDPLSDLSRSAHGTAHDHDACPADLAIAPPATLAAARHLAGFDVPILIIGAAGTGKTALARAVHDAAKNRGAFHEVRCAGLSDAQIRSRLMGVRPSVLPQPGAESRAAQGTLFLNGIDRLCPDTQTWLARSIQNGHIAIPGPDIPNHFALRLIAGSQTDLRISVADNRFLPRLYYALAVGLLNVPPLADRRDAIPALALRILRRAAERHGKKISGFSDEALAFLTAYHWPGNLPELENEITRMLIFSQERTLGPELISRHILQAQTGPSDPIEDAVIASGGPLKTRVEEIEKRILREVLTRLKWNKSRAATELGLSRVGLRAKLDRYGLCPGVVEAATDTLGGE